ncbi:MAG: hypothetical protein ACE5JM_14990 [Armatimonadota bacterium]
MLLADNPFEPISVEALTAIYRWPEEAVRFVEGEGDGLHIVGDAGMGKTALLLQLQRRLEAGGVEAPYTCFPVEGRIEVDTVQLGPVTLLDETDRLSVGELKGLLGRLRETGQRAALAGHRDQGRRIGRARLSCMYLALGPLREPVEAAQLVDDRIALATGTRHHEFPLDTGAAAALLLCSGGNIERCLQLAYEIFEDLERPRAITADDVAAAAAALSQALR